MRKALLFVFGLSACGGVNEIPKDAAVKQDAPASDGRGIDAATCVPTPSNLNARWRGDGNTNDDSGNAYNGTAIGTLSYTPGKHGMAYLFDGSSNFVRINEGDALWPSASFSVEAWVKTTSTSGGQLVMKYQCAGSCPAPSYAYYSLRFDTSGNPIFEFRSDASATAAIITDTTHNIADGNWHHLVGVRDVPGQKAVLYLDGAVAGMLTVTGDNLGAMTNTDSETDFVTLGAGTVGGTQNPTTHLAGALDEVAFYKSALTAAQVAAIYAAPEGVCK